jgi:hypothetical protein
MSRFENEDTGNGTTKYLLTVNGDVEKNREK